MFQREGLGWSKVRSSCAARRRSANDTGRSPSQESPTAQRGQQRLEHRLSTGLDPEVRDEVYQRVLKRLEKIDVLRYPRKILSLPIRGLKSLSPVGCPARTNQGASGGPESTDPVTSETFHVLESELIRLGRRAHGGYSNQPGLENLLDRETFQRLKVDHDEAKSAFAKHYEGFTTWLAEHARETASQITGENKAKFIVSQVLFNTLLITAQVHTGGAFSLFELGMDGVLSPFVAKAVGMAIGNDKVKEFEEQAHRSTSNRWADPRVRQRSDR